MGVCVVTGASAGIGRAIAVAFGAHGWDVAIGARRTDRLAETAAAVEAVGGRAFSQALDVRDPASVDRFFEAVEAELGVAAAVIANAGMSTPGAVHEIPVDALRTEVETNLFGAILTARRAVAAMIAHDVHGDVGFVTSDAVRDGRPRMATYAATKAGVEAFSRSLGMELEGTGIRAITFRVGPTMSEFGFGWDMALLERLMPYWQTFGLQRHAGLLQAEQVANAVVAAVGAPRGMRLSVVELQAEAPVGEDSPLGILTRPESRPDV